MPPSSATTSRPVTRTRAGEQAVSERETIVFRRDGDRWAAVHEHLSPRPEPTA